MKPTRAILRMIFYCLRSVAPQGFLRTFMSPTRQARSSVTSRALTMVYPSISVVLFGVSVTGKLSRLSRFCDRGRDDDGATLLGSFPHYAPRALPKLDGVFVEGSANAILVWSRIDP